MTDPAVADYLAAGSRLLDRFTVQREIGRGGFSVVYAAHDDRIGADVALKLLVPPPAVALQARERMRREVHAVRRLAHRHIAQVYDFVEDGPRSFVVMELIRGTDLAVRVREKGPLKPEEAARIGAAIAEALGVAHAAGILHRDVKPSNILLADDGRACLTDFGSAKLQGMVSMTQTGGLPGTLDFLAPEVLTGGRPDARADLYALGLTLFVALTGQLPRRASPHLPPPASVDGYRPRALQAAVPEWLDAIVAHATTARPWDRFPSAALLSEALVARDGAVLPVLRGRPAVQARCAACHTEEAGVTGLCDACVMGRRWVPLPRSLVLVAGGMILMGTAAALRVAPLLAGAPVPLALLAALSPALAGVLLLAAQRQTRGRSRLPRAAGRSVAAAMRELRPGAARRLLVDIVAAADAVYPGLRRVAGASAESDIALFLGYACGAAAELTEVDELLATLEAGRDQPGSAAGDWAEEVALTERRRDALTQRMLDTLTRLARMGSHAAQAGASSAGELGAIGAELETALQAHAEAMREVEQVLALRAGRS